MLKRVGKLLRRLGLRIAAGSAGPRPERPDPAEIAGAAQRERRAEQLHFIHSLERMRREDPAMRSHIYIVSLADFRETVADKWDRLATKVGELTRIIIRRNLDKADLFCQADDETFVLAMPRIDRHQAHLRIASIANDLTNSLVGSQLLNGNRPIALTANADMDSVLAADGGFDILALRDVVAEARAIIAKPGDTESELAELMKGAARLTVGRPLPGRALPAEAETATPSLDPLEGWQQLEGRRKAFREWQMFRFDQGPDEAPPPVAEDPPLTPITRLRTVWRPCWDDASGTVSTYHARILRNDQPGGPVLEGNAAYPAGMPTDLLTLDRQTVMATAHALHFGKRDLGAVRLIVPLCFGSLHRNVRWSLTGPLADLPSAIRRERIAIELIHLPRDVGGADLKDVVDFIAGLGCKTLVRLSPSSATIGLARLAQAHMIGLDLSDLRAEERMGDEDLVANLDRFHQMAEARELGCYLWGVRRRRVLLSSILAGYDMVNGPALMKDVGDPGMVFHIPEQLLAAG